MTAATRHAAKLPALKRVGNWDVDELVPGWIAASAGHRFGLPSLMVNGAGSQLGIDAWGVNAFVKGYATLADAAGNHSTSRKGTVTLSHVEILVLAAFVAGMQWQNDTARRKRMDAAVSEGWDRHNARREKQS